MDNGNNIQCDAYVKMNEIQQKCTAIIFCFSLTLIVAQGHQMVTQATGLDAWASRVKYSARFVSHLHEICIYIWVVYSFCLFCCLFIILTWWYVWCIVWASGWEGVNSIPELELQLNSNSNSGIGIEIGVIENGIGIENSGIGIEKQNYFFCNCYHSINQQFPNFSFNRGHNLTCDWQGCFKFLEHCPPSPPPVVWSQKTNGKGTLFPLSRQQSEGLKMVTINISLPQWHKTKLLSLLNRIKWMISGLEVKLSKS